MTGTDVLWFAAAGLACGGLVVLLLVIATWGGDT